MSTDASTPTSKKAISLPEFDPLRFNFWVKQVTLTLKLHNLFSIVDGTEQDPFPDAQEPFEGLEEEQKQSVKAWRHRHTQAHEALMWAIQKTPAESEVFSSNNAIDIWKGLKDTYGFKSVMTATLAEGNYTAFCKSPTSTMREHIAQFEHLLQEHEYHRLTTDPIQFAYKNVALMNSICLTNNPDTDKWQTWFNSIQDTLDQTPFPTLCAKLRAYAERGNQQILIPSTIQPADSSQPGSGTTIQVNKLEKCISNDGNRRGIRRGRGGYRGNHGNRDNRGRPPYDNKQSRGQGREQGQNQSQNCGKGNRGNDNNRYNGNSNNGNRDRFPKCRHCGRTNHYENDCWFKNGRKRDDDDNWGYNNRHNESNHVVYSSVQSVNSPYIWVYDTGSNTHLHNDHSRFHHYQPFEHRESVFGVGGRQSNALGRGSIVMSDPNGNKYFVKDVLYVPNADKPILSVAKAIRQGLIPMFKPNSEFLLSAHSNDFVLQGNTIDDILYIYEAQTPHITNAVTTRAHKRKTMADEQNVDAVEDSYFDQNEPIRERHLSETPSSSP